MTVLSRHEDELIDILRRTREVRNKRIALETEVKAMFLIENRLSGDLQLVLRTIADESAAEDAV